MANQRDKDKRLIGAFVPSKLKRQVEEAARRDGIAVSDWVKRLLVESVGESANSAIVAAAMDANTAAEVAAVRRPAGAGRRPAVPARQPRG